MKKTLFLLLLCLSGIAGVTPVALAKTPGEVPVGGTLREATMTGLTVPFAGCRTFAESHDHQRLGQLVWPVPRGNGVVGAAVAAQGWHAFTVIGISTDDHPEAALAFVQKNANFVQPLH